MLLLRRLCVVSLLATLLASTSGCIGLAANLIHAGWGNLVDARFDQLAMKKIAVICMSSSSSFGNSSAAEDIAAGVESRLGKRIPEITIVDQQAIADWMDQNDWNEMDYRELSDGLQTDYLIAIDLDTFSLYEGQTLYKGRAEVGMRVYDSSNSQIVYETKPGLIQYPVNGGQHTADMDEKTFRGQFLDVVASQLARHFYSYDVKEDYGRDPSFVLQ